MQIPILSGIYVSARDFRTKYPRNYIPVPKETGIAKGYLKPSWGLNVFATGPGIDRGGIAWNGVLYRVMGTSLVAVSEAGAVTTLGDVGGSGPVRFSYSFDRLAVQSGTSLYYYDASAGVTRVTDPDLGSIIDQRWKAGYFVFADKAFVGVTELTDPYAIDPLKYGSSELDPDNIVGLDDIQNELNVVNRYTIEPMQNVGGDNFPFQVIQGAQVQRGACGTHAFCKFQDVLAFVGSGRNEAPGVYIAASGQSKTISTREIDTILKGYSETQLSRVIVEAMVDQQHQFLFVHLSDRTLIYDGAASAVAGDRVWFVLTSGIGDLGQYRARNFVWCYDRWIFGDPQSSNLGVFTEVDSFHYGEPVSWEFTTQILYNAGKRAIVYEMELCGLPGGSRLGDDPVIWASYSLDGELWSQEKPIKAGKRGEYAKRLVWRRQGKMHNYRLQKFRGTSDAHMALARLEMQVEALK